MDENLVMMGLAVTLLGLLIGSYLMMPLERFISLLAMVFGVLVGLLYPWALASIMKKLEEEEHSSASSQQN